MEYIKGDLLDGEWDFAIHCANSHCVMGSGIAYYLARKWPQVSEVDDATGKYGEKKLGYFSVAEVEKGKHVINLYGQVGVGNDGAVLNRNCSYDHLYNALFRACTFIDSNVHQEVKVGVPYGMAACRAGGSWIVIDAILKDMEDKFAKIKFVVIDKENGEMDKKVKSSVFIAK